LISFGNLLLGFVVATSFFFRNWWQRILIFSIAGFFVKFYPGFDMTLLFFILSAAFGSWLGDFLRKKISFGFVIAILASEVVFNILISI